MKKFQYPLQKILDLKEREKEQAEWAFGKSVQKKNEEEEKLMRMHERKEELTIHLFQIQADTCSAAQLLDITRYRQTMDKAIQLQQKTLYGCEQEMEAHKQRLTMKMQETQLWNKLREKAKDSFDEAEKLRDQKEMDEIGINRYLRKSM